MVWRYLRLCDQPRLVVVDVDLRALAANASGRPIRLRIAAQRMVAGRSETRLGTRSVGESPPRPQLAPTRCPFATAPGSRAVLTPRRPRRRVANDRPAMP